MDPTVSRVDIKYLVNTTLTPQTTPHHNRLQLTFFVVDEVCVGDVEDEAGEAGLVAPQFLQDDPPPLPLVTPALAGDGVLGNADVRPHPLLEPDALPPHWELTACTVERRIMVQLIANLYKENFRPPNNQHNIIVHINNNMIAGTHYKSLSKAGKIKKLLGN